MSVWLCVFSSGDVLFRRSNSLCLGCQEETRIANHYVCGPLMIHPRPFRSSGFFICRCLVINCFPELSTRCVKLGGALTCLELYSVCPQEIRRFPAECGWQRG